MVAEAVLMLTAMDIQEIKNLMYTYARCVDQRDHVRLGELLPRAAALPAQEVP